MTRIRVGLENVSSVSSNSAQQQRHMEANFQTSLVQHQENVADSLVLFYQQIDQGIGNVEELLKQHTVQLQGNQSNQLGTSYGRRPSYIRSEVVSRQPS